MTLRELIEYVGEENLDLPIIMSSDSEGNSYSPQASFNICRYFAKNTYSGRVVPDLSKEQHIEEGYDEEDFGGGVPSVVLWPIN